MWQLWETLCAIFARYRGSRQGLMQARTLARCSHKKIQRKKALDWVYLSSFGTINPRDLEYRIPRTTVWQVSWLTATHTTAFPIGSVTYMAVYFCLQWRDRAGFSPASLFSALYRRHQLFLMQFYVSISCIIALFVKNSTYLPDNLQYIDDFLVFSSIHLQ